MIASARDTSSTPLEFVFYTDDDAPLPGAITELPDVVAIVGPRITLSAMWNECAKRAAGQVLMQCDDECVFRSPDWDVAVHGVFGRLPDKIAFVHGRDLHQPDGAFGTLGFLHRRWVDTVGYFTPPYFSCDYGDTWLNDVSNMIGRRIYLPDVVTEHMHPIAGKGEWDQTHQERLARGGRDDVAGLYARLAPKRVEDAAKLAAVMTVAT
jgi:hypothetical protein